MKEQNVSYIERINERIAYQQKLRAYNSEVEKMGWANSEGLLKITAAEFKKLGDFKNSKDFADQCLEKAEVCRKNAVYNSAKEQMLSCSVDGYSSAIKIFKTIPGWLDADRQIEICSNKIDEIKELKEKRRIDTEKRIIAEEAAEKKRKKNRKRVFLAIGLLAVFLVVLKMGIIPAVEYNQAMALLEEKYEEAYVLLLKNGEDDLVASNKHDRAVKLIDFGDYDAAYALFEETGEDEFVVTNKHDRAVKMLDTGDYNSAYVLFSEIGEAYLIDTNKHDRALALLDSGEYESAYSLLDEIGENDLIESNKYDRAVEAIDAGDYESACLLLNGLTYNDSEEILLNIKPIYYQNLLEGAEVGDSVYFGAYEQDNDKANGKEDIEWIVLSKEKNKILVISKYSLDCQPFSKSGDSDNTWANCWLRRWLNSTFYSTAFSLREKSEIQNTNLPSEIAYYDKLQGASRGWVTCEKVSIATEDKLFLLGENEISEYMHSAEKRKCAPTAYAEARGASISIVTDGTWWWLRTPEYGNDGSLCAPDGELISYSSNVYFSVRPAMWISIEP